MFDGGQLITGRATATGSLLKIGKLPVERWRDYRALRLEALRNDPQAFGSSTREEEKLTKEDWERRIRDVLFALDDDKPVGMTVFVLNDRPKTRHVASIFGVYVSPKYRRKGLGTRLLKAALLRIGKREGIVKVKLAVNPEQQSALRMYEKAGFVVVGRMRKELKVGRRFFDELMMEMLL